MAEVDDSPAPYKWCCWKSRLPPTLTPKNHDILYIPSHDGTNQGREEKHGFTQVNNRGRPISSCKTYKRLGPRNFRRGSPKQSIITANCPIIKTVQAPWRQHHQRQILRVEDRCMLVLSDEEMTLSLERSSSFGSAAPAEGRSLSP